MRTSIRFANHRFWHNTEEMVDRGCHVLGTIHGCRRSSAQTKPRREHWADLPPRDCRAYNRRVLIPTGDLAVTFIACRRLLDWHAWRNFFR